MNTNTTDPVYLRPLTEDDFTERYLSWFTDEEFTKYLEAKNISREDAVGHLRDGKKNNQWFIYAICERENGRHIGNVKIGPIQWRDSVSDLVTVIGEREVWGKGYGRIAIAQAIELAFNELNIRKLSASMVSANIGSLKAYTAAGFAEEARLKNHYMRFEEGRMVLYDKIFIACENKLYDPARAPTTA